MQTITYVQRRTENDPMFRLLLDVCIPDENGNKSISVLARARKLTSESIHKWIREKFVHPSHVKPMVDDYNRWRTKMLENAALTGEEVDLAVVSLVDFHPYVFRDASK